MTSSVIHPCPLNDIELGKLGPGVPRKSSRNFKEKELAKEAEYYEDYGTRTLSSSPSLSAELVESVMYDGQFRFINERAQEAAMWCALIAFLALGVGLVMIGLSMAVSSM